MVLTFKCENHKFESGSIEEWDKHIEEEEHTTSGSAPCALCGFKTDFEFTGKKKPGSIPCICDKCKGNL